MREYIRSVTAQGVLVQVRLVLKPRLNCGCLRIVEACLARADAAELLYVELGCMSYQRTERIRRRHILPDSKTRQ
jgi:hypothetical protein